MKRNKTSTIALVIIISAVVFGLFLRALGMSFESTDYLYFLSDWVSAIKNTDGIAKLGVDIGDYNPSYIYILTIISLLPINELYAIKTVSIIFDVLCGFAAYKIIYEITGNIVKASAAFGVVFMLPTVIVNSGWWAQCDSIFTFFLLMAAYYSMKDCPIKLCVCYGISFVFKLQSIFFAPVILVLLLQKKIKIRHMLTIPLVYFISIVPSVMCGRNLMSALLVYLHQTGTYKGISVNAPSFWGIINGYDIPILTWIAIMMAAVLTLTAVFIAYKYYNPLTKTMIIEISLLILLLVPYFLPRMHERYFYPADVASAIYAVNKPKRWYVSALIVISSFISYSRFLFKFEYVPLTLMSGFMGAALIFVVWFFANDYNKLKISIDKRAEQ